MSSSYANYLNKSIDLACFQGISLTNPVTDIQQLFSGDNAGQVCTGMQKLIQRWLLNFLTVEGSLKFNPDKGTSFLVDILSAYSYADVETYFQLANMSASTQTRAEEDDAMSDDERLETVTLESISFFEDHFMLYIKVTSQYGDSVPVTLPINTNPLVL